MTTDPDSNHPLALVDSHRRLANGAQSAIQQPSQARVPLQTARPADLDTWALATTSWYRIAPHRLRAVLFTVLLSCVLLLTGASIYAPLRDSLPASRAAVKIIPVSHTISNQYTLTAVLGTPDSSHTQVTARLVAQSTPFKSLTVPATGKGQADATAARGTITIKVLNGPVNTNIYFTSDSGVVIIAPVTGTLSEGSITDLAAFAQSSGLSGNVPALDIHGRYAQQDGTVVAAQNSAPFSGGQDAHNFTTVQQSDIDRATQQLQSQFTDQETAAAQSAVQRQLATNEQLLGIAPCQPDVSADHQSGEEAKNVTVKMAMKCEGIVYKRHDITSNVHHLLEQDALAQSGPAYSRTGKITTAITLVKPFQSGDTAITFQVRAQGLWSFTLDKRAIASQIVGKKRVEADALLAQRPGVKHASIETSGGMGTALPTVPENIQVTIN